MVYATARRTATIAGTSGDAGVNPADPSLGTVVGRGAAESFFSDFDTGLLALSTNLQGGAYDGDPAQRALAEQTLAGATAFRDSLRALVLDAGTASPFLPTATSGAGTTLAGRVTALQATLSNHLGVTSFATPLPLPVATDATFDTLGVLATDPAGDFQYTSFAGQKRTGLGDAEVGAVLTLADSWDRKARGGFRLAVEGLLRLPTGMKVESDAAYPAPVDGGQTDVQVQAAADMGRGNFGVRLAGGYQLQLASTVTRRVAPPGTVMAPLATTADVSLDPGDELFVGVTPFWRLARPLGLLVGVQYRRRSDDAASYEGAGVPGLDAAVLGEGTGYSTVHLSLGINYSDVGRGVSPARMPIDAGWSWDTVIAASGGRVARSTTIRMLVRLYGKLW